MQVQFKSAIDRLKSSIRTIPDFPQPGIQFRDITPILEDGQLFRLAITIFAERYKSRNVEKIAAVDARGFIFAGALSHFLGAGLVLLRKKGKLPFKTHRVDYDLEYGSNTIEMHVDSLKPGERVVLIDDLLATGGTAAAAAQLVEMAKAQIVEIAFLIELVNLSGRARLAKYPIFSAMTF